MQANKFLSSLFSFLVHRQWVEINAVGTLLFSCTMGQACWKRGAGGAAAPPDFGGSEGAAGQRRRAALLPAPPDF